MSQPSAISIVWDIVLVLDHEQQQAGRSVRHSAQWGMSLFFDLICPVYFLDCSKPC